MKLTRILQVLGLQESGPGSGQLDGARYGRVVPDASRCVQCGVCGYNCPVGIPVREYARQGLVVDDPGCITCGQCINVCPRGTLRWESDGYPLVADLFAERMGYLIPPGMD